MVQLTKSSQTSMLAKSNLQRAWGRKITIAGAPAGAQEPYWEVNDLPAIQGVDSIFVSFDTTNTASQSTCTFNIWYKEYSGGY